MKVRLNNGDSDGCEYRRGSFSIVLKMSIIGSSVCGRRNQTDDSLRHSLMVIVSLLASQMSSTNASKSLRNCSAKSRRILICSSDLANSSSSAIYFTFNHLRDGQSFGIAPRSLLSANTSKM